MRELVFGIALMSLLFTGLFQFLGKVTWVEPAYASTVTSYHKVVVETGDSLWKLADQYNEEHRISISDMIQVLMTENQLESAYIYPGQVIQVPNPSHK